MSAVRQTTSSAFQQAEVLLNRETYERLLKQPAGTFDPDQPGRCKEQAGPQDPKGAATCLHGCEPPAPQVLPPSKGVAYRLGSSIIKTASPPPKQPAYTRKPTRTSCRRCRGNGRHCIVAALLAQCKLLPAEARVRSSAMVHVHIG
jgi:hypothetical protein